MTKEHALPSWVEKYAPSFTPRRQHVGMRRKPGMLKHKPTLDRVVPRSEYEFEVRVVCELCNTGWMHKLETDAEPQLIPLFTGSETRVTPEGRALIARWAFKTVAMLGFLTPETQSITPNQLRQFHATREPPPISFILVYPYDDEGAWRQTWAHRSLNLIDKRPDQENVPFNTQLRVLVVGKAAFIVITMRNPTAGPLNVDVGTPPLPVCPLTDQRSDLRWPPGPPVLDGDLENLVGSFDRTLWGFS